MSFATRRHVFFATCPPGLEPVLHEEAKALKLAKLERQVGGVRFEGTLVDAVRANLWFRTAVRVLLRLERFAAQTEDELYARAGEVDWELFLEPEGRFFVDVQTRDSRLDHSLYIAQRIKDAIVDRGRSKYGVRPSVDKEDPDLRIHAHVFRDRVTLSADSSGESLHKRGWRRHQGRAPLAETLAAGVVALSDWDARSPLIDPFCGSGTLLIEAALRAQNRAPGLFRERFGLERWPVFVGEDLAGLRAAAASATRSAGKLRILGSDRSSERVEEARENAGAAGVDQLLELEVADASQIAPRKGWNAWVVSNPPYGQRVGERDELFRLHARFGERLREHASGFTLALLSGNPALLAGLEWEPARRIAVLNGGLECELWVGEIP